MRLCDKATVKKLHDIEGCANNTCIFTEAVCFRYRYIRFS